MDTGKAASAGSLPEEESLTPEEVRLLTIVARSKGGAMGSISLNNV